MKGYVIAVEGMPEWAIGRAVRSFIRGTVPHQDKKFCPRAPEFAVAVKDERDSVMIEAAKPSYSGGLHTYKSPKSKILEEPCSKDWARRLVEQGIHPRGCIWVPGEFGTEKHAMGTLFAPDPEWENAKPLDTGQN